MDSKKLGMIAAAALTVIAAQAQAGNAKKDAQAPAAKGEAMACANTCGGVSGSGCGGKVEVPAGAKDPAACKAANGQWMPKAKIQANMKPGEKQPKADDHGHEHKH